MIKIQAQNRIKEFRCNLGLTQQQLGQKFKKPKDITVISRWERGVVKPSADNLVELCRILRVKKPSEFFLDNN